MRAALSERFEERVRGFNPHDPNYVPRLVDSILAGARDAQASDIHLRPCEASVELRWRIDGVLQTIAAFPRDIGPRIVGRLKVLSDLLTYRTDVPQEGRLLGGDANVETRVSTFPTLFGEKVVIRLFIGSGRYRHLADLGLPPEILETLRRLLDETGGVILLAGPAGSGKTTTIYAALREIVNKSAGGRSLVSLEDPIEVIVDGVDQSQVNATAGFDMHAGLRSLLRQDPEVMMVGEIRDRGTAETVFQASLTGHLVVTTFHAGSAARALSRLADMGIEPYLLRSGLLAILCQRLLRRLCTCAAPAIDPAARLGLPVDRVHAPVGCELCSGTGYRGRMVLAEMLIPDGDVGAAILERSDAGLLESLATRAGMVGQWQRACHAIEEGRTSPQEAIRVLGLPPRSLRPEAPA
jgi:type II secretory ATPase GspE/PulE/Tfp pilus assembly ATPase PilB-like protein